MFPSTRRTIATWLVFLTLVALGMGALAAVAGILSAITGQPFWSE